MLVRIHCLKTSITKIKFDCIYVFAFLHLFMTIVGLYRTIKDIIDEGFPVSTYETSYVTGHFVLHFILIGCLVVGQRYEKPPCFLFWLVVNFIVFITLTYSWIESLAAPVNKRWNIFLLNVATLGVLWTFWIIVLRRYLYRSKPLNTDPSLYVPKTMY